MRSYPAVKVGRTVADTHSVNTIAATATRIPRTKLIAIVALLAAFALLMVVRVGLLGGTTSSAVPTVAPPKAVATPTTTRLAPTKPRVVLLPGLPTDVAHALRYSKVIVVSIYVAQAPGDRAAVGQARTGSRAAGAGFVAINVGNDRNAAAIVSFAGPVSSPSTLIVRRPGRIVTQISGPIESAVVMQAAHNAGARR